MQRTTHRPRKRRGDEGYEGTPLRLGIIKVAGATSTLTDWEKKNFRAAARAQRECRVPIVEVAPSDLERLVEGSQIDLDGTRGTVTLLDPG